MTADNAAIARHYGRRGLVDAARAALGQLGLLDRRPTPEQLAPLDQFHTGGWPATVEMIRKLEVDAAARVLDVGGGAGGPARALAEARGCRVTVLDLTPEYCELGEWLTDHTGLADRVAFRLGDALAMPFGPATFDLVWTQHSTMNLPDKAAFAGEVRRVLTPGGRYALHEVVAGDAAPRYPVPWAADPALSWLVPAGALQRSLLDAGLEITHWDDVTAPALDWIDARVAATATPPPLGLHLLLGDGFAAAIGNHARNLREGRVRVVRGVAVAR